MTAPARCSHAMVTCANADGEIECALCHAVLVLDDRRRLVVKAAPPPAPAASPRS